MSEVLNPIFGSVLRPKKAEKMAKLIEPVYPATTFHKMYIDISLCMGYPAGELLVLGWELRFQALCHLLTVLEAFKGPKIYGSTYFWNAF